MDFDLTEEQRDLQQNARAFMVREIIPIADEYDRKRPLPKELAHELLKKTIQPGYLHGIIPEEYGGLGLEFVTYGILFEELARAWAGLCGIVLLQFVVPYIIVSLGTEEQKKRFLPPILSADKICCFAITEPDYGSNSANIQTTAVPDGNDYVINGTKTWITNGTFADIAIVVAVTDRGKGAKGMSLIIVDKEVSPFSATHLPKLGLHAFASAELGFQDCRVPQQNLLGELGAGYKRILTAFEVFRCGLATMSVGIAQAAIDAAVKYAQERHQFARPIASFQLIQEMVADMITETETARLLTWRAWSLLDKGVRCEKEAAMAKAYATEVGVRVASKAIEIHGAYGVSEDYPLERYFRDARTMTIPDGTTEIMKLIVGRRVLGLSAIT